MPAYIRNDFSQLFTGAMDGFLIETPPKLNCTQLIMWVTHFYLLTAWLMLTTSKMAPCTVSAIILS